MIADRLSCISAYTVELSVPYFFGYKSDIFSFLNNPKNLDSSYKRNLDLWDCLGKAGWPRTLENRENRENGEKKSLQGKIREFEILLKIREFKKILSL